MVVKEHQTIIQASEIRVQPNLLNNTVHKVTLANIV